jgi:hypothetical protein
VGLSRAFSRSEWMPPTSGWRHRSTTLILIGGLRPARRNIVLAWPSASGFRSWHPPAFRMRLDFARETDPRLYAKDSPTSSSYLTSLPSPPSRTTIHAKPDRIESHKHLGWRRLSFLEVSARPSRRAELRDTIASAPQRRVPVAAFEHHQQLPSTHGIDWGASWTLIMQRCRGLLFMMSKSD